MTDTAMAMHGDTRMVKHSNIGAFLTHNVNASYTYPQLDDNPTHYGTTHNARYVK